jgi:hypothetical protein
MFSVFPFGPPQKIDSPVQPLHVPYYWRGEQGVEEADAEGKKLKKKVIRQQDVSVKVWYRKVRRKERKKTNWIKRSEEQSGIGLKKRTDGQSS